MAIVAEAFSVDEMSPACVVAVSPSSVSCVKLALHHSLVSHANLEKNACPT
jgi:hypothetical protein